MAKNEKTAAANSGSKTNYLNGRSMAFSTPTLPQADDWPQTMRIYAVTERPDIWRIMDHARIHFLRFDLERCRDRLAVISRIASGGIDND